MIKLVTEDQKLKQDIIAHNEMLARTQKNRDKVQGNLNALTEQCNLAALTEQLIKLQANK